MSLINRIQHFPISSFSIILGMTGLTIALEKIHEIYHIDTGIDLVMLLVTLGLFALILGMYLMKLLRFPQEVRQDFEDPVRMNFFPTISISLLLLSIAFLAIHPGISKGLWIAGTLIHTFFTYKIIAIWMMHPKFEIKHINPAWFIPVVGNILIPVAGVVHFGREISWFFYSIGLVFWILLFTIFIYRMVFHSPMVEKLLPTLAILIAPPAVGFIAYVKLTGELDSFGKSLYYFALFLTTFLLSQWGLFSKIKFYLSWWAYSFPISSMTIATVLMYHLTNESFFKLLSGVVFGMLLFLIIMLVPMTLRAIRHCEICIEE